jgi:hypothetical protein
MLTIVWDVDDVLNDLMAQWFVHGWLPGHPGCLLTYRDLTANPPHLALGVDRSEYLSSLDAFHQTDHAANMTPSAEVLAWFSRDGHRFRHIALTARPLETAPTVAHWVFRHFGAWIRCFGVVPSRAGRDLPAYDTTKAEFLAWLGRGDILIDDSPETIRQAQAIGLKTLMPRQPWNQSTLTMPDLLENLTPMAGSF